VDPLLTRATSCRAAALVIALAATVACHPGPVVDTGDRPPNVGGTISGTVRADGVVALAGRMVTATNEATGAKLTTSTSSTGGYTIQVPAGKYRLDLELHTGETLSTRPDPTDVNVGDLDDRRDFVVTVQR
jgi:hypothetical protein